MRRPRDRRGRGHRERTPAIRVIVAIALVLASGCASDAAEVVDFGVPVAPDAPALPADSGLDVTEVADPALAPPRDAVLAAGGWDATAAFVAREAAEGRPVVVNLFASWCSPCAREMPMIVEAAAREEGITFLGIAHLDADADARTFVAAQGIAFPTLLDVTGEVAYAIGGRGMPTTVAFDRQGRLVARVIGELTPASFERLLAAVR